MIMFPETCRFSMPWPWHCYGSLEAAKGTKAKGRLHKHKFHYVFGMRRIKMQQRGDVCFLSTTSIGVLVENKHRPGELATKAKVMLMTATAKVMIRIMNIIVLIGVGDNDIQDTVDVLDRLTRLHWSYIDEWHRFKRWYLFDRLDKLDRPYETNWSDKSDRSDKADRSDRLDEFDIWSKLDTFDRLGRHIISVQNMFRYVNSLDKLDQVKTLRNLRELWFHKTTTPAKKMETPTTPKRHNHT